MGALLVFPVRFFTAFYSISPMKNADG